MKALRFLLADFSSVNRTTLYALMAILVLSVASGAFFTTTRLQAEAWREDERTEDGQATLLLHVRYQDISQKLRENKEKYPQIDLTAEYVDLANLRSIIASGKQQEAEQAIDALFAKLVGKASVEQGKGIVRGKVTDSLNPLPSTVKLIQGETTITEIPVGTDGAFTYWLPVGTYLVQAMAPDFVTTTQSIEIATGQALEVTLVLIRPTPVPTPTPTPTPKPATPKPVATPKPTTVPAATTADGIYSKESISTSRGTFTVHLLKADLSQYEMRVDTAADGDCENNCPVKSLSSYVSQNGAVAGIHGTYFCPTSYADCAGKTNSFYYKLYNTRLDKKINWGNGLGDYLPFLYIDQAGTLKYSKTWDAVKDLGMKTGISCRPHLVEGGQIVLTDGDMDSDKERYSKISHGFIGMKGQTVYVGIVLSANVPDSAAVAQALGLDNAFNIDGGGTSAMFYNGSYKVGPGRDMPNAIVFVKK